MVRLLAALAVVAGATGCPGPGKAVRATGKERTTPGTGITVYSSPAGNDYGGYAYDEYGNPVAEPQGWAVVKEWRKVTLDGARTTLRFTDVARQIDATTVHFRSVTDPAGTQVLEQNFEYDLVSADKILEKHVDRPVTLVMKDGKEIAGKLLSFDAGQLVLETSDVATPLQIIGRYPDLRTVRFADLPGGLITKPTLVWLVAAQRPGEHLAKVTYQTGAMGWEADYTTVIAADERALDVTGWVTIHNQSGATYKDAELKLVAGDVNRAPPQGRVTTRSAAREYAKSEEDEQQGFVEKAFFEYHMYTLGRTTTLPDNSVKQIELFDPVDGVPAKKVYFYFGAADAWWGYGYEGVYTDAEYGTPTNKKVDLYLEFKNEKAAGLGIPLPAGRVRVYKKDPADGSLELIGEDRIDHTPKDEQMRLKLGSAFDVVGERKVVDFDVNYDGHRMEETVEVELRNHKDEDVEVLVKEVMYRAINWKVLEMTHPMDKKDARTTIAKVKVGKNGKATFRYKVQYTW